MDILTKKIARAGGRAGASDWPGGPDGLSTATQLADLRIRLADAQATLTTKESERAIAQKALERAKELVEKAVVSQEQLEDVRQADYVRASAVEQRRCPEQRTLHQEVARLQVTLPGAAPAVPRRVTLGDVDSSKPASALDLATGKLILLPPNRSDKEDAEALA